MTTISFEVDIDLFVATLHSSPRRSSALCSALRRNTPHRNSTQRFVCYIAPQLNSMQLVWPRRAAAHCISPQLNDLFVTTPLHAARLFTGHHGSPPRTSPQLNSTICLLHRSLAQGVAAQRYASQRPSTQRNELKL